MQTRSVARTICWILALLFSTLACQAATRLIIPDTPTPLLPTASPAPTATLPPTLPPPSPTPIFESACPSLLSDIMAAATIEETEAEPRRRFEDEQDFQYMVTYTLLDDKLGERDDIFVPDRFDQNQDARAAHEWIWDFFAAIIPSQERDFVTEFSVMSDGRDHILAAVSRTIDHPEDWGLRVDILDSNDHHALAFTLMHEFGHLLTLNASQVTLNKALYSNPGNEIIYERAVTTCPQYFADDSCSQPDSYLNEFFNRYWTGFYAEWQEIDKIKGEVSHQGALRDFYRTYQDQFLTDYAPTSPEEDIAESWAFFIFAPRPELTSIANEKILFFYEYPELVQLRQEILTRLCVEFPQ